MIADAGTGLQLVVVDLSCYVGVGEAYRRYSLPEVVAALSKLSQS